MGRVSQTIDHSKLPKCGQIWLGSNQNDTLPKIAMHPDQSCNFSISVVMAAYNGSKYIESQVASISPQLRQGDELIIVDDHSSDRTVEIVRSFEDSQILVVENLANEGVLRTFERALSSAKNELIFLCDQDDIWKSNKVARFREAFASDPGVTLVLSDANVIDGDGNQITESWVEHRPFTPSVLGNLLKNRYLGCTMAFRRSMVTYFLPFPPDIPMHDMWIGNVNQIFGKTLFIDEPLMSYRRHPKNTTAPGHASLPRMLSWRYALAKNLVVRIVQVRKRRLTVQKQLEANS
jgi:glycosyltransferase involved in cell wall biosynthesis